VNATLRLAVMLLTGLAPRRLAAQELEPRSYAVSPIGLSFAGVVYVYSRGEVVTDPASPVTDIMASVNSLAIAVGGTFAAFGRSASVSVAAPYGWAHVSGKVGEDRASVERSGLIDTRLRLAITLLGGEALTPREFARRLPATTLGASLSMVLPTGQYSGDKLINLGTNRWAFKPELGLSHPLGPWSLEFYTGAWFFAGNPSFYGGQVKTQDPLLSLQSHVAYTFRPRTWLAADATFYYGGRAQFDGVPAAERQENTRLGLTLSLPVHRATSLKLAWSSGTITRLGGDFDNLAVALQTTVMR
jgi:hypothetical protein